MNIYFARLEIALLASTPLSQRLFPERSRREVYARAKYNASIFGCSSSRLWSRKNTLQQLKDKQYADTYRQYDEPIHLTGVEFSRESRNIDGFEVDELIPA